MELLLWRWSTTAQITSALMIAVFFVVMSHSVRRVELRPWVRAWLANLGAMMVTSVFWLAQPRSQAAFVTLRCGYFFFKTMFVVLLAVGVWTFGRSHLAPRAFRIALICAAVYSLVAGFAVGSIDGIGVVQSAVMGLFLGASAIVLVARRVPGSGWLAAGFVLRALLAFIETAAYATQVFPDALGKPEGIGIFLAAHSSLDTGAEWVIALGCVLTIYRTIQEELTRSNQDLLAAKETLQELVDRDSLTGLANRRALPGVLRDSFATGATILFFDLNDFKEINDSYGHQTGDACLKRFAAALESSFRPEDHVIRYAGDEFVVVARGSMPEQVLERTELVRERLKFDREGLPAIRFSVGHSYLPVHGEPEAALRAADEAMYRDKAEKPRRLRSV